MIMKIMKIIASISVCIGRKLAVNNMNESLLCWRGTQSVMDFRYSKYGSLESIIMITR